MLVLISDKDVIGASAVSVSLKAAGLFSCGFRFTVNSHLCSCSNKECHIS
uniref:Uncharacterized protein n=1 Tax=Arundo donax TaxID=35708 RepID=A0A0A9DB29_ARUDO